MIRLRPAQLWLFLLLTIFTLTASAQTNILPSDIYNTNGEVTITLGIYLARSQTGHFHHKGTKDQRIKEPQSINGSLCPFDPLW